MQETWSMETIRQRLVSLSEEPYRDFIARLIPTMDKARILGVRTPALRKLARDIHKSGYAETYLQALSHQSYEETNLHACLIAMTPSFDRALTLTQQFLPHVDNWATCDSFTPKAFKKQPQALYPHILTWLRSPLPYTQRYGVGLLMNLFLGEHFDAQHLSLVAKLDSPEYYVNMMRAWYFSMALAFQWEQTLPLIKSRRLDTFTHRKAIQKAIESRQIPQERKDYLKTLR